jgi:ATP-dependent helicase/nuclease subunit A
LQWHANEVPVNRATRLLRIDRLVQDRAGVWWVLDYKSNAQPQLQADLCAQLSGYRATVQSAYPAQTVRCAFLTPQGALIEISTP